ncbi:hypothetical protein SAMN02745751_01686 [Dethiosulfatibacter aminovorans DSM 17477]|uniref:GDSL-like Lipase/Acylhydrolase family protein n=1 Tax=Dethiosulfatibacter aminovorans DSM 17477 TaxID=1121476 RepID=A0A1M6GBR4_9FIRM|nr:hypothetical protein [Dethiosulfatibacter aminovorans]SHJ07396.1 hypothetical protein SAMN02745751_01686 [Dethiosulfatibacter aminovorans DSM 17477]
MRNLRKIRTQLDGILEFMNGVIERNANRYGNVHLVDVHQEFIDNPTPSPVGFVPPTSLDPHPTIAGQELIYDLLTYSGL